MIGLFSLYNHPIARGFFIGISCVMMCRSNYTGLVCRMFDEDDPFVNPVIEIEMTEINQV